MRKLKRYLTVRGISALMPCLAEYPEMTANATLSRCGGKTLTRPWRIAFLKRVFSGHGCRLERVQENGSEGMGYLCPQSNLGRLMTLL